MTIDLTWQCPVCKGRQVRYTIPMNGRPATWSCRECGAEWTKK